MAQRPETPVGAGNEELLLTSSVGRGAAGSCHVESPPVTDCDGRSITGEPLDVLCVPLPPGSMMSAAAHMPHGVEPRLPGRGTTHPRAVLSQCSQCCRTPRASRLLVRAHSDSRRPAPTACSSGTRLCTLFAYAKPDPLERLVRSPERRAGGYAVSPEVLQAAAEGRIMTVQPGLKNFFTMH